MAGWILGMGKLEMIDSQGHETLVTKEANQNSSILQGINKPLSTRFLFLCI